MLWVHSPLQLGGGWGLSVASRLLLGVVGGDGLGNPSPGFVPVDQMSAETRRQGQLSERPVKESYPKAQEHPDFCPCGISVLLGKGGGAPTNNSCFCPGGFGCCAKSPPHNQSLQKTKYFLKT